jgi:RNA polymerase-binding transcription factor DksA
VRPTSIDRHAARARVEEERIRLGAIRRSLANDAASDPGLQGDPSVADDPADFGSETFEREKTLSMLEHVDRQLVDLDRAMHRIDAGTYGSCEACGHAIDPERLEARPGTRFCIADQAAATAR